eukprot:m.56219 g.56219  ORF g.56219 m.56219 type:complete len:129 (-) comp13683_c0_seq29:1175-1561(-)
MKLLAINYLFGFVLAMMANTCAGLNGDWSVVGSMPSSRSDMTVVKTDEAIAYIFGGCTDRQAYFDPFYGCTAYSAANLKFDARANTFEVCTLVQLPSPCIWRCNSAIGVVGSSQQPSVSTCSTCIFFA